MKIQGELNGIKIDIECPEIVYQDGKWWEPVAVREAKDETVYAPWDWKNEYRKVTLHYCTLYPSVIYREIPEPSQEWLDANRWVKSERPEIVNEDDLVFTKYMYSDELNAFSASKHIVGKYRFKLTPKPDKTDDELAKEYARAFLANDISAGQLLTKLEGMK